MRDSAVNATHPQSATQQPLDSLPMELPLGYPTHFHPESRLKVTPNSCFKEKKRRRSKKKKQQKTREKTRPFQWNDLWLTGKAGTVHSHPQCNGIRVCPHELKSICLSIFLQLCPRDFWGTCVLVCPKPRGTPAAVDQHTVPGAAGIGEGWHPPGWLPSPPAWWSF